MKSNSPLVFRLNPDLQQRLEKSARELKLKKYTLAIMAIEAAVEAIEQNDYRLVLPIKFRVEDVPKSDPGRPSPGDYPPPRRDNLALNDKHPKGKGK